jgi:hypothetical protein
MPEAATQRRRRRVCPPADASRSSAVTSSLWGHAASGGWCREKSGIIEEKAAVHGDRGRRLPAARHLPGATPAQGRRGRAAAPGGHRILGLRVPVRSCLCAETPAWQTWRGPLWGRPILVPGFCRYRGAGRRGAVPEERWRCHRLVGSALDESCLGRSPSKQAPANRADERTALAGRCGSCQNLAAPGDGRAPQAVTLRLQAVQRARRR